MKIVVTPEQLYDSSYEMKAVLNHLRENMDAIELFVASLDGEWKGDAERAYASKIVYVRSEFRNVENFLKELSETMGRIGEEYSEHEDVLADKLKRI